MGAILIPSLFLLVFLSICVVLLLSFAIIVVWWALVYHAIKWASRTYGNASKVAKLTVNGLVCLMMYDIPCFLWYVVAPFLLLLYICCLLANLEK